MILHTVTFSSQLRTEMHSFVTEVWDTKFLLIVTRLHDVSQIHQSNSIFNLPTETVCLDSVTFEARKHRNSSSTTVFAALTGGEAAAAALKHLRGTVGSSIGFHVLKEPSHSNGSSEAPRWLPPKGGRSRRTSAQTRRPRRHLCCA